MSGLADSVSSEQLAGMSWPARRDERGVSSSRLGKRRTRHLAILVTQDAQVHNRILTTEREYAPSELEQAANYFNASYAGVSVGDIKRALLIEMQQVSDDLNRNMQLAMRVASEAFDANDDDELVVRGEEKCWTSPSRDIKKLRRLFEP